MLKTALRQDRLLFAFQPVVCATTGKVDYHECLLRMRDERGEIAAGAEFIATVEHLGLIGLVDRFVLERVIEELARLIPGAEIKIFPRGGHFLTHVRAREFNNAVLPFLGSHTPA